MGKIQKKIINIIIAMMNNVSKTRHAFWPFNVAYKVNWLTQRISRFSSFTLFFQRWPSAPSKSRRERIFLTMNSKSAAVSFRWIPVNQQLKMNFYILNVIETFLESIFRLLWRVERVKSPPETLQCDGSWWKIRFYREERRGLVRLKKLFHSKQSLWHFEPVG